MSNQTPLVWQDPAWREEVTEWIRAEAERRAIHITGEIEQPHMYAWSTVLHIPTDQGKLFFKATAHETIYEATLTESLARWLPDCMPEFVAVDAGHRSGSKRKHGNRLFHLQRDARTFHSLCRTAGLRSVE